MAPYDRDASLERQQIREISLNVARRLREVLDRNRYIPAELHSEVDGTVRVITGIQRDVDQIMAGLPETEALDFAILAHIMGGQRHALDLLEILEEKLEGSQSTYQRDSARVHQALLTVSREIEQDALRYTAAEPAAAPRLSEPVAMPHPSSPAGHAFAPQPARAVPPPYAPAPPPPAYARPVPQSQPRPRPTPSGRSSEARSAQRVAALAETVRRIQASIAALAGQPVPVAITALVLGAGLVVAAQSLIGSDTSTPAPAHTASADAATTARERSSGTAGAAPAAQAAALTSTASASDMEQPYLVVLATRRSTEELQQDYRSFKASYPDLLGNAKARVDRVQGQDSNTWYRLSLIPPRTHGEAKSLCGDLRTAGLTGCWIKPVPLR